MRVPSSDATGLRRVPQQMRATLRREHFLDVAGRLIGESGYEGATMTAIADRAGASIGTLYDYFSDKQTLALALLARYMEESDAHWAGLLAEMAEPTRENLADVFIEGALSFARERPAYLPLLGAPLTHSRSAKARLPLRTTIAEVLQAAHPALTDERAFLSAQIVVELIKGLFAVYRQAAPKYKTAAIAEFKALLKHYLTTVL